MTHGALARREWSGEGSLEGSATNGQRARSAASEGPRAPALLIVDDEPAVLQVLQRLARPLGFTVVTCPNGRDAIRAMRARPADLALVDLRMPDISGLDVLRQFRQDAPHCDVILMTAYGAVDSAVEAMKLGAREYMSKPFDFDRLRVLLTELRDKITRRADTSTASQPEPELLGMIGVSAVMRQVFGLIPELAQHASTLFVCGEAGTGKEAIARAFHQASPRRHGPFVRVNCPGAGATLEREVFGSQVGEDAKPGLIEAARGGTVFLDEVGDLPPGIQATLLRTLESGTVLRVGALEPNTVACGFVAATTRNLQTEVASGRFRADLYYRLTSVLITLPPLRERREDISVLAHAFVRECAARLPKAVTGLSEGAVALLARSQWDANVRELRNRVERACALAKGRLVTEADVRAALSERDATSASEARSGALRVVHSDGRRARVHDEERDRLVSILRGVGGNRAAAAKVLGISRHALCRQLERHQIAAETLRAVGKRRAP
jgi:DNA-binding NtrC family response regulator